MQYYMLAYTPEEIDRRLALAVETVKWHIITETISNNPDFAVGDFLYNPTDKVIRVGIPFMSIEPGMIMSVVSLLENGIFTAGDVSQFVLCPRTMDNGATIVDTDLLGTDTVVRLSGNANQQIILSDGSFGGRMHATGTTIKFFSDSTGIKTFEAGGNIMLCSRNNRVNISGKGGAVTAVFDGASRWFLWGDLS